MAMTVAQKNFQKRVQKLNKIETKGRTARIVGATPVVERSRAGSLLTEMFMVPFALFIGAFSILLARVLVFHFATEGGSFPIEGALFFAGMFGDIILGVLLAITFSAIYRLNYGMRSLAGLAGFVGMMWYDGELMSRFPEVFSLIYSDSYVADMLASMGTAL